MLLAMSVATQRATAEIIMPCNGAFYTDNIRISDKDFFEGFESDYFIVPFKAWFDFPCSFCTLRITMPPELKLSIRWFEDENGHDLSFQPGKDFNSNWELAFCELEDLVLNENGEYSRVYDLVIWSGYTGQVVLWEPVSYFMPSEHYKVFSLGFEWNEYYGHNPSCKIGDIEITSYMINYSNVTPLCPTEYRDDDGHRHYTRYYTDQYGEVHCAGDVNCDGEINISDMNTIVCILFNECDCDYERGDVNLDGIIDIIDLISTVEVILNDYWYTGHKIEEGHCTVSVRYRSNWYDVDGDGNVTIGDVTSIIDSLLDGDTVENQDVDGDGNVTIADVVSLIDYIVVGQP